MTESYSREEIFGDHILTRLSVKSLLRYKRVCKRWRDLIKSSSFIKKHYDHESVGPRKIIAKFGVDYEAGPIRQFHLYLLPDKIIPGRVPTHQRIYYYDDVKDYRNMHGPINGMFLLENGHSIEVRFAWWNPATKQCRVIPYFEFDTDEHLDSWGRTLGMGFDKTNQDYKIIWLRTFRHEFTSDLDPKVYCALYSTKNNSWKLMESNISHERDISYPQNCTYKNGVFHWLISSNDRLNSENVYTVLTFNFETEEFQETPGPPIPGNYWATVMLRGGSLAAMAGDEGRSQPMIAHYDIWQRIREDNWVKVYTVNPPIPSHSANGIWGYDLYFYECLQNYKVLCYDQSTKQVINLGFDFFEILESGDAWAHEYKESLFPMPLRTENPTEEDNVEYFFREY